MNRTGDNWIAIKINRTYREVLLVFFFVFVPEFLKNLSESGFFLVVMYAKFLSIADLFSIVVV